MLFSVIGIVLSLLCVVLLGTAAVIMPDMPMEYCAVVAVAFGISVICLLRNAKDLDEELRRRKN